MNNVLKKKRANKSSLPFFFKSSYKVSFIIDNKINLEVSIFNREYIVDLLENINKFNQLAKLEKLSLA